MSETPQTDNDASARAHAAEMALTRLKQRYQLAGVVLGTSLVSIVGSWLVFAEQTQRNEQSFDSGHREFVAQFVAQAIGEDIEQRQRLARYFATVTLDDRQRGLWANYADYVDGLIETNAGEIAQLRQERTEENDPARVAVLQSRIELLERQLGASRADRLTPESASCNTTNTSFPARWLCIAEGELSIGVAELPGPASNARIIDYARFARADLIVSGGDEIPWSGLFVNWVVAQSGVPEDALPADPLRNASWIDFGVPLDAPIPGAVAILQPRIEGTSGFTGFLVREEGENLVLIGGNVRNAVSLVTAKRSELRALRGFEADAAE